jgi:hypothetical protein
VKAAGARVLTLEQLDGLRVCLLLAAILDGDDTWSRPGDVCIHLRRRK